MASALVVLMTNVIDEVNANQVQRYLTSLVGRHLPIGVLCATTGCSTPSSRKRLRATSYGGRRPPPTSFAWRRQVLTDLAGTGALTLDVFPEELTALLINRYLEVKARHLL